ncbi:uncharacterized protein [Dermacentor andersoni]|uniref:uncharacterized protein n=1 Tax=Dermacentor andersoni TaxID=34620 RepID=UPI003B3A29ED
MHGHSVYRFHSSGWAISRVTLRTRWAPQAVVSVDDLPCTGVECVAVTVRIGTADTCVASVYACCGGRWDKEMIVRLSQRVRGDLVMCGDFNSHNTAWGSSHTDRSGLDLLDAIQRAALLVANTGCVTFTRRGSEGSVLDLSLVSERCHYVWRRSPDMRGSDHYPIHLEPRRAAHLPTRAAERIALRSGKREHWTVYNRLDAVCRRHAKQCRNASWSSLCSSLERASVRSSPWRILGAILRPRAPRCPVLSIAVARGITSGQLAELLAETFCPPPIIRPPAPYVLQPQPHPRRELLAPERYFPTAGILEDIRALCEADFTIGELRTVLTSRKLRSAPGSDGVTYQMLRNLDGDQLLLLLDAYNNVWRTGSIPDEWSEAIVVPLLKAGKAASSPASYRPVSLTSAAGKVLEAMALRRLEWITAALDTLAAEQSGFRRLRATADCLADVIATLETAKRRGEAGYLILLDVESAFDRLPHATIMDALDALGVCGRMRSYIAAFLGGRTMRVRVAGALSRPRVVVTGVPQGSVLSPFLFNLALARIPDYIPQFPAHEVRVAVYADDIALFAIGPTSIGYAAAKTKALIVHPRYEGQYSTPGFTLHGVLLPWEKRVRYLGLVIDRRLNWRAAVAALRKGAAQVAGAARSLLARGQGCSPTLALRLYNSVASARILYALPLADLQPTQWKVMDADHRAVVRQFLCLPRSSQSGATLAEAGETPISLRAEGRALNHVERLHRSRHGQQLISRLHSLPSSGMGRRVTEFANLVRGGATCAWLAPPPHRERRLLIRTTVPGVRGKRNTPLCALQQETAAAINEQLAGRVLVFTDGSVLRDGAAAAACVTPDIPAQSQCTVLSAVSSTHAELAAIDLAAELIYQRRIPAAAILTDSRAALHMLARADHGPPLIQRLLRKIHGVCEQGCDLVLQWVPAHIGIHGNEEADRLARAAHTATVPRSLVVTPFDVARHTVAGMLRARHPDARVASGNPPRLLPRKGLHRRDRALLLRLRVGCYRTAARTHRLQGTGSPFCEKCADVEDLDHVLLRCREYTAQRDTLTSVYRRLGLPCDSTEALLFPAAHSSVTARAFAALLEFLDGAELYERL